MSQMIYELASVQNRGNQWVVTNVMKNSFDNLVNREEKLLKLSYMSYKMIQEALIDKKKVIIFKERMMTDEVLPGEFEIVEEFEEDNLQQVKNSSITKIRMLVTPELSKISGFALYGFIVLNNDLSNEGYFITNDNREEKYLQILETGDEKLISKLEDYLNYKDEIESVSSLERKFSKFSQEIKQCSTEEQVKELEKNFLENFYKSY
jgi:hypothetical protein